MKYLLDTCTFLWYCTDDAKLPKEIKDLIRDSNNDVCLSSASAWEIAIKYSLGNLELPEMPRTYVAKLRKKHHVESLAIAEEECLQSALLPQIHKDPFDRIIIAQSIVHDLTILSPDRQISQYAVKVIW